jgi:transcriptional regulator with XRE-family HTH domain
VSRRRSADVQNALAELILQKKAADGLTLNDIAQAIGVSQPTVSRWTSGTIPDIENVGPLARWLGVTEAEVIGRAHERRLRETRDAMPLLDDLARNIIRALEQAGYDLAPGSRARQEVIDALARTVHEAADELESDLTIAAYRQAVGEDLALAADAEHLDEGSAPERPLPRPRPEPNE